MIDNNYNQKFRKFFSKFEEQYENANDEEKSFLWDLSVEFVEKNRDFVMQYPIVQYWKNIEENQYANLEKLFFEWYNHKEINLYFHIPFCKTRCTYCNFHIVVWDKTKDLMTQIYLTKLKKEIDLFTHRVKDFKIKTIFIWWGTPSYLEEEALENLLGYIQEKLWVYFKEDIEFSFEWNPDSFNETKLSILKKYWVNRLSFWVQTFNNEIIKKINRTYTKQTVYDIIDLSKKIWFTNINIDMIYGLPWHNYDIMKKDLEIASKLDVTHLTYYPLYYYDEATLSKTGSREDNVKQIYSFYDEVVETLNNNDLYQYGREYFSKWNKISHYQNNFVSNGLLYWFWQSAYSFNGEYAFKKDANLQQYLKTNYPLVDYFEYDNNNLDRRLFVLWSRNIDIEKQNLKDIENNEELKNIICFAQTLWLIEQKNNCYHLTNHWLKYQEVLAHMFV